MVILYRELLTHPAVLRRFRDMACLSDEDRTKIYLHVTRKACGCLLSLILLLPYCIQVFHPLMVFCAGLLYAGVVVPVLVSYISLASVIHVFLAFYNVTFDVLLWMIDTSWNLTLFMWENILDYQKVFLHLKNVHSMTNQIVFFLLMEKLICPEQKLSSLYSLMFYHILAYIKRNLREHRWSQYIRVRDVRDLIRTSTTFIALKMGKAVVLTFSVLMMTAHMQNCEPDITYIAATALYFVIEQKEVEDGLGELLQWFQIDALENLEMVYAPIITRCATLLLSFVALLPLMFSHPWLCLVAFYTNVFIKYEEIIGESCATLAQEKAILDKYKIVLGADIAIREDGEKEICPICLDRLDRARLTPCSHLFHGHCLRRWLNGSDKCPMCKQKIF